MKNFELSAVSWPPGGTTYHVNGEIHAISKLQKFLQVEFEYFGYKIRIFHATICIDPRTISSSQVHQMGFPSCYCCVSFIQPGTSGCPVVRQSELGRLLTLNYHPVRRSAGDCYAIEFIAIRNQMRAHHQNQGTKSIRQQHTTYNLSSALFVRRIVSDRLSDLHLITLLANVTWFGPNRFAADMQMRGMQNLAFW